MKTVKLTYRKIGTKKGKKYPDWIRELKKKSGVYVIKSGKVRAYIGESHKGKLYETLTRHFQTWERTRNDWSDWSRHTGHVYDRAAVTVAVLICSPSKAPALQFELIRKLKPRDNEIDGSGTAVDREPEGEDY